MSKPHTHLQGRVVCNCCLVQWCRSNRNCTLRLPEKHMVHTLRMHFHDILWGCICYAWIFMVGHPLTLTRNDCTQKRLAWSLKRVVRSTIIPQEYWQRQSQFAKNSNRSLWVVWRRSCETECSSQNENCIWQHKLFFPSEARIYISCQQLIRVIKRLIYVSPKQRLIFFLKKIFSLWVCTTNWLELFITLSPQRQPLLCIPPSTHSIR
jgi:hypothetical protein